MQKHLAIFAPPVVKLIFSGQKTIDCRFSQRKIAPFGKVSVGDIVYIKPAGADIKGQFKVKKVIYFAGLEASDWDLIVKKYGRNILPKKLLNQFSQTREKAIFGTLIFMNQVEQFIVSPIKPIKKDRRGWVTL